MRLPLVLALLALLPIASAALTPTHVDRASYVVTVDPSGCAEWDPGWFDDTPAEAVRVDGGACFHPRPGDARVIVDATDESGANLMDDVQFLDAHGHVFARSYDCDPVAGAIPQGTVAIQVEFDEAPLHCPGALPPTLGEVIATFYDS